ncbi:MAG: DUF4861 family protein [Alistipes sp.]|nr:DUF4861 family protein [Alistipes sp.]MBR7169940.1 DUF4861 family protein [Alistipes sp.]
MKRILLAAGALLLCLTAGAKSLKSTYRVSVEGLRKACPVVIDQVPAWAESVTVSSEGEAIPAQLDKVLGEAAFVADVCGERLFTVRFSDKPLAEQPASKVNAQMWWKNEDKSLTERDTLFSFKDDMYRKLHHHGPAIESEKAAYRVYFDKKQTIDTYGKKSEQLELRRSMWYSTPEQLAAGFGHDNLRVFGSIGVGVLKGWDEEKGMIHITDFERREARVLAKGPVRAIMEMRVEGWNYGGRRITMTSRYTIYAGHSDVVVENRFEGDVKGLTFVTGVMKMLDTQVLRGQRAVAQIGCDHPENDYNKWPKETVALAVALPEGVQIISQRDDKLSYLFQVTPNEEGRIDYVMDMWWRKSTWLDDRTNDELLSGVLESVREAARPIRVERIR